MTCEVSTSDPSHGVEFLGSKQHNYRWEDADGTFHNKDGMVPNLVVLSLVPAQCAHQDTWVGWRAVLFATFQTHLKRDLAQVSVSFRNGSTRFQQHVSKSTAALQLGLQVLVTWHASSGLSALMRPWRCDSSVASLLNLSDPPLRVVNVRLHDLCQHFECCVHSQFLTAAHVQRLRVNVHFNPP